MPTLEGLDVGLAVLPLEQVVDLVLSESVLGAENGNEVAELLGVHLFSEGLALVGLHPLEVLLLNRLLLVRPGAALLEAR